MDGCQWHRYQIRISDVVETNDPDVPWNSYAHVFIFFCGMMVLQLIWVTFMVPETKGRSLEEIQRDLGMVA